MLCNVVLADKDLLQNEDYFYVTYFLFQHTKINNVRSLISIQVLSGAQLIMGLGNDRTSLMMGRCNLKFQL